MFSPRISKLSGSGRTKTVGWSTNPKPDPLMWRWRQLSARVAFMSQTRSFVGNAGSLIAIIGFLTFLSAVFSFTPRVFLIVGIGLIVLSFVAFFLEEFGPRRA